MNTMNTSNESRIKTVRDLKELLEHVGVDIMSLEFDFNSLKEKGTCYVVQCICYSDDDSTSVFWKEEDAYKSMIEDMETEITNLQDGGYEFVSSENDTSAEVHVPDSDIYYEWEIIETDIQ